jgi:hypothetical protein
MRWGLTGSELPPPASPARLRITNSGAFPIKSLSVWFPEDRIKFGDVPAGATTDYVDVPRGVYSYAAYELQVNGQLITQPVIDWVGERPLAGTDFTYVLDFDPGRETFQVVQLVNVNKDR